MDEGVEEKKPDENDVDAKKEEETKLSQEEIDKLLKETETENPPGK